MQNLPFRRRRNNNNWFRQKLTMTILAKTIPTETKLLSNYLITTILNDSPTQNCIIKGNKSNWNNLPISKSLFGTKPNCGLPIGNLTSQLFSNIYLHTFDSFMKNENNINHYGRYVDDFYIVHTNSFYLKEIIKTSKLFLTQNLKLTVHPNKIFLQHYTKGVNFLGATIKPYRIYLSNRTKNNFKEAIKKWEDFLKFNTPTLIELNKMRCYFNSYFGIMIHYKTYNIGYKALIQNRNKQIYKYGYIESINNKKMKYCFDCP